MAMFPQPTKRQTIGFVVFGCLMLGWFLVVPTLQAFGYHIPKAAFIIFVMGAFGAVAIYHDSDFARRK